jgi:hypothetical protein
LPVDRRARQKCWSGQNRREIADGAPLPKTGIGKLNVAIAGNALLNQQRAGTGALERLGGKCTQLIAILCPPRLGAECVHAHARGRLDDDGERTIERCKRGEIVQDERPRMVETNFGRLPIGQPLVERPLRNVKVRRRHGEDRRQCLIIFCNQPHLGISAGEKKPAKQAVQTTNCHQHVDRAGLIRARPGE